MGDLAFGQGVDEENGDDVADGSGEDAVFRHGLANFDSGLVGDGVGGPFVAIFDKFDACNESDLPDVAYVGMSPKLAECFLKPASEFLAMLERGQRLEYFQIGQGGGGSELIPGEAVPMEKGTEAFVRAEEAVEDFLSRESGCHG